MSSGLSTTGAFTRARSILEDAGDGVGEPRLERRRVLLATVPACDERDVATANETS